MATISRTKSRIAHQTNRSFQVQHEREFGFARRLSETQILPLLLSLVPLPDRLGQEQIDLRFCLELQFSDIFSTELGSQLSSIQHGYNEISKQKIPKITTRTFILQKYGF